MSSWGAQLAPLLLGEDSSTTVDLTHYRSLPHLRDVFSDLFPFGTIPSPLELDTASPYTAHILGLHNGPLIAQDGRETDTELSFFAGHNPLLDDCSIPSSDLLVTSSPSSCVSQPPTPAVPPQSSCPSAVRFDVFRMDSASSSLQHIAFSETAWKAIPRFPVGSNIQGLYHTKTRERKPRRAHYAPGLNPVIDATRAELLLSRSSGRANGCDGPHAPEENDVMGWRLSPSLPITFAYGPLSPTSQTSSIPRALITGGDHQHCSDAASRAAHAQAEFEDEIRAPLNVSVQPGDGDRCSSESDDSLSPLSSTEHTPWSTNVFPAIDSGSASAVKRKKPCDVEPKHVCPRCGRAFTRPSSLRVHGRAHTGFRPFVCPASACGRMFSVLSNMKRHYRTHFSAASVPAQNALHDTGKDVDINDVEEDEHKDE